MEELPVSACFFFELLNADVRADLWSPFPAYKFPKAQERLDELKRGGVKVQKNRERLSRSNQRQNDADCVVM